MRHRLNELKQQLDESMDESKSLQRELSKREKHIETLKRQNAQLEREVKTMVTAARQPPTPQSIIKQRAGPDRAHIYCLPRS